MDENKPVIAGRKSIRLELPVGHYYWCGCGRSANQPFCDMSHRGTHCEPVRFEVTVQEERKYCLCKHTKTPPFCDGAHKTLPEA